MFKALGSISNFIIQTVDSLTQISRSVDNVVSSVNHATSAMNRHAQELDLDAEFECRKRKAERENLIKDYEAQLEELSQIKTLEQEAA